MKPKLDTKKIRGILAALDRNMSWLARQSGVGRQWIHYDMRSGCLNRVDLYAKSLGIEAANLIILK